MRFSAAGLGARRRLFLAPNGASPERSSATSPWLNLQGMCPCSHSCVGPRRETCPQRVVIMLFDGFQLLEPPGPADVFSAAGRLDLSADHRVEVTGCRGGGRALPVRRHRAVLRAPLRSVKGPIDTLLVVGGDPSRTAVADRAALVPEQLGLARLILRVGSICSVTRLAGRGKTAGGAAEPHLIRRWGTRPPASIRTCGWTQIVSTCATATCGLCGGSPRGSTSPSPSSLTTTTTIWPRIHLAGWLFAQSGADEADRASSERGCARGPLKREPRRDLEGWIEESLNGDLSVEALGGRVNMSVRHFSRVFRTELVCRPGRARAGGGGQAMGESTDEPLDRIATRIGLGTPETLYRVFHRHLKVSPGEYRADSTPRRADMHIAIPPVRG